MNLEVFYLSVTIVSFISCTACMLWCFSSKRIIERMESHFIDITQTHRINHKVELSALQTKWELLEKRINSLENDHKSLEGRLIKIENSLKNDYRFKFL